VVPLLLDVSDTNMENEQLTARLGVDVLPTVLLLDSAGQRVSAIEGAASAAQLLELLSRAQR
jgi:thioredoxin-like negative regulator of GroEL